ncbi:aminopeptidase N-like [Thrips palmi]|uniref:Aminopeptidase N-like n=1 Tax=Thrips palmi TaxID=161013 RepID=A0A6P8Z4I3_THRPL|nr:aminopeptidase N-like [Thrips palmi]
MADPQPPQRSRQRNLGTSTRTKRAADDVYDETLLPTNVVPTRYTVTMAPNLATGVFYGATDIYINVVEATSRIILHGSPDITFNRVEILKQNAQGTFDDNGDATLLRLRPQEDADRLVVDLQNALVAGEHYLLRFPLFKAYLRNDGQGFFLTSYENANDQRILLAATQFEATAARYAFPCFDEPALKARFKIIVEHDPSLTARSNMPEISRKATALTIVRTEFDDSLPMSTYLLAWVVSTMDSIAATSDASFTTWGRPNMLGQRTVFLANEVGPKALQQLAEFTGIPYALPKVDQFALPDLGAGAMENWGLVTYKEEYLLETGVTTIRAREFIGTSVCHELGHQWAGDLVTLDWWSNTWLNEGFATYFESVICDKIFPDWKLMEKFVADNLHVAVATDALPGQLAMSSPVTTTDAIDEKFGVVSYQKGGAVLLMFEHILGTEVFKKGLNRYLSANSFKTGSPDGLFRAMNVEAVAASSPLPPNTDFATMAKTWTEQAGVPVVTVTRNTAQGAVTLTQEQFFYETPEDQQKTLWYVPIPDIVNPKTKDWTKTAPVRWLTPDAPTIADLDVDASATEWIVVNPRQIGYYLVNYDADNWKLLHQALLNTPDELHPSTRTQLVHDSLAMARAGKLDYATALPFLQALKAERSPAVWKAGIEALTFLRDRLANTEAGTALKAFIQQITADAYDALGFGSSSPPVVYTNEDEERYLRYLVASHACYADGKKCVEDAVKAVTSVFDEFVDLPADVADAALCTAVRNSDALARSVLEEYMDVEELPERRSYALALGCTRNHNTLETLLDNVLNGRGHPIPTRADLHMLVDAILSQRDNHRFMLDYFKKNYIQLKEFGGRAYTTSLLNSLIEDIRAAEEVEEIARFIAQAYPDPSSTERRDTELRLDLAMKGLEWHRKYFTEVSQWLYAATNTGPVTTTTTPTTPTTPIVPPRPTTTRPPTTPPTRPPTGPPGPPTTSAPQPQPTTARPNSASTANGVASLVATVLLALTLRTAGCC